MRMCALLIYSQHYEIQYANRVLGVALKDKNKQKSLIDFCWCHSILLLFHFFMQLEELQFYDILKLKNNQLFFSSH